MCLTGHPHGMLPKMFFTLRWQILVTRDSVIVGVWCCVQVLAPEDKGTTLLWSVGNCHLTAQCHIPGDLDLFHSRILKLNFVTISYVPCAVLFPIPFVLLELTMWIFGEEFSSQCCKIFKPEFYKFLKVHHVKLIRGTVATVCSWMFIFISALYKKLGLQTVTGKHFRKCSGLIGTHHSVTISQSRPFFTTVEALQFTHWLCMFSFQVFVLDLRKLWTATTQDRNITWCSTHQQILVADINPQTGNSIFK